MDLLCLTDSRNPDWVGIPIYSNIRPRVVDPDVDLGHALILLTGKIDFNENHSFGFIKKSAALNGVIAEL